MKSTQGNDIYKALKEKILFLELEPGQKLNIKELSSALGVSRSPIRDAFLKLSNERLVNIIPQSGCQVTKITIEIANSESFIRRSIELSMIQQKNFAISNFFLATQKANLELQKDALKNANLTDFFKLDEEFHNNIFKSHNLSYTWEIIKKNTCSAYQRIRIMSMKLTGIADSILEQHTEIFKNLSDGNFDQLYKIEKEHLSKIDSELPFLQKEFPDYFLET